MLLGDQAHDDEEEEEEELTLTTMPPELCQQLCQFLPALSLLQLPLVSDTMGRLARKEMEARHARLDKRQVMILTEMNQSTNILNKITMLCPGLVVLYDSNKESEESEEIVPQVGPHTVLLRLERPLFSTTSPSLSQCLLTAHLSSSPGPRAISLSTILSNRHHLSPVLLLSLPVTVNLARKVRNLNTWNTVHTEKDVTELVGRASVREVRLETEESEAQARLARELISRELEQDIQLYFNTDHLQAPNVYEVECSC